MAEREAEAERLEAEMAEVCGVLHAATARLVGLIGRVLETEAWQGFGIRSPQQWVAWRCGVSPHRAHTLLSRTDAEALPSLGLQHPADQPDQSGAGRVQHTAGLGHFGFQPLGLCFPFRHILHRFII